MWRHTLADFYSVYNINLWVVNNHESFLLSVTGGTSQWCSPLKSQRVSKSCVCSCPSLNGSVHPKSKNIFFFFLASSWQFWLYVPKLYFSLRVRARMFVLITAGSHPPTAQSEEVIQPLNTRVKLVWKQKIFKCWSNCLDVKLLCNRCRDQLTAYSSQFAGS